MTARRPRPFAAIAGGFTLIELRVVVFVIAILAWFAYPSYVEMRAPGAAAMWPRECS